MKSGKGNSLDESSLGEHSIGLKSAASESQLNDSSDSFLSPRKDKPRSGSKLSLIADKVLDTAKLMTEKQSSTLSNDKHSKNPNQTKSKSSKAFSIFKKSKSRDPSPMTTGRARSTEYSSLDRKNFSARTGHLDKKKSPRGKNTIQDDVQGGDLDKELIPYEFQEAMASRSVYTNDDSEFGYSEYEINEMNALAEQMEEYHFSVRVFPGQDPNQVCLFVSECMYFFVCVFFCACMFMLIFKVK